MRPLHGKIAIVTGSARGIGREIALRLARDGADVAVNYAGNAEKAGEVVSQIRKMGNRAIAIQADVAQISQIKKLFAETRSSLGRPDILVNNAGLILYKKVVDVTEEDFDRMFAVNVKGTFFACQEAITHLNDGGRIINLSSSTTGMLLPTYSVYVATKGAVEQMTRSLAKEVGHRGITVNVVSPGPTDTELFREGKTEAMIKDAEQRSAFGRLGQPADIADAIAFLASEQARWITAQNIRVNGGTV